MTTTCAPSFAREIAPHSDAPFLISFGLLGGTYVVLIVAMLAADLFFTTPGHIWSALGSPEIRYAIKLSLITCTFSTLLSL